MLPHLIFKTILWVRHYYNPHCIGVKNGSQREIKFTYFKVISLVKYKIWIGNWGLLTTLYYGKNWSFITACLPLDITRQILCYIYGIWRCNFSFIRQTNWVLGSSRNWGIKWVVERWPLVFPRTLRIIWSYEIFIVHMVSHCLWSVPPFSSATCCGPR